MRNDPRTAAELIQIALTETDEDAAWTPVAALHYRATREVLSAAERLCASSVAKERKLGADILGQLGVPDRAFPEECFQILSRMLSTEDDPGALNSITTAFGHLDDPRCVDLLIPLKSHLDSGVRFGVVLGLIGYKNCRRPEAIQSLIELSRDVDDEVRNWATCGLGGLFEVDNSEIGEALLARLSDPYDDARAEALVGLAYRKDTRVTEPLLKELGASRVGSLAVEAAVEIGDSKLLPALLKLREWWPGDSAYNSELILKAIKNCGGGSPLNV